MKVNNLFSGTDSNPSRSRPTVSLVTECIAVDVSVYKLCLWFYVRFNDSQGRDWALPGANDVQESVRV